MVIYNDVKVCTNCIISIDEKIKENNINILEKLESILFTIFFPYLFLYFNTKV